MRKFALATVAAVFSIGIALAGEVAFVKYDAEKKALTVKENDKEVTYKITDETKVTRGDKEVKLEKALKAFAEKTKEGTKLEINVDKEKHIVSEIKLAAKKDK